MPKAAVRKFKCSKCDRTFSMAAHLARHKNTVHAAKSKTKVAKKKGAKRKVARKKVARRAVRKAVRRVKRVTRRTPAVPTGGTLPLVQQMQTYRTDLIAQRNAVDKQIDAIDKALAALGTAPRTPAARAPRGTARRGRRRAGGTRAGSLKDYIARVLGGTGKPMAVKDVTSGVLRSGFKTTNKTLAKSVGIALTQMPNVRKVSRGLFRLK